MTDASSNMLGKWAESAVYWAKHQGLIRAMFAPVTDALMVETGISRDDLVLDVAAGPGEPSMTIADRVGPSGRVCCTDGVLPMVLASRTEAGRRKLRNIDFCQCRAEALPFRDAAFDALVCRFGVMFCEDPTAAAREMLRVTKPTRWISLAAWSFDEVNPFHSIVTHVLNQYDPVPATDFNAVGGYRFAPPGKLQGVLEAAGAKEVRERLCDFAIEAQVAVDDYLQLRTELSDSLRARFERLPAAVLRRVQEEVRDSARSFFTANRMRFPAQVRIVTARA